MEVLVAAVASSCRCGHELVSPSRTELSASKGAEHESVADAGSVVGTDTCTGHDASVAQAVWATVEGGSKSRRSSGRLKVLFELEDLLMAFQALWQFQR